MEACGGDHFPAVGAGRRIRGYLQENEINLPKSLIWSVRIEIDLFSLNLFVSAMY